MRSDTRSENNLHPVSAQSGLSQYKMDVLDVIVKACENTILDTHLREKERAVLQCLIETSNFVSSLSLD
jgi:hypothetical protein